MMSLGRRSADGTEQDSRAARLGHRLAALAGALAMGVTSMTGCGTGPSSGDLALRSVTPGHPMISPSGAFQALVEDGPAQNGVKTWIVVIHRAGSGQEVFRDDEPYSTRHGVLVTWLSTKDQLWIVSGDVGHSHVDARGDQWVKTDLTPETMADLPPEIERLG